MATREEKRIQDRLAKEDEDRKAELRRTENLPVNVFLNSFDEKGNCKYGSARIIRKYFSTRFDPVLGEMRLINSKIQNIRHNLVFIARYSKEYDSESAITLRDNQGRILEREELYNELIIMKQSIHTRLASIREEITGPLFVKVDREAFTFEMFDDYVKKCVEVVKELGYDLFPENIEIIYPM